MLRCSIYGEDDISNFSGFLAYFITEDTIEDSVYKKYEGYNLEFYGDYSTVEYEEVFDSMFDFNTNIAIFSLIVVLIMLNHYFLHLDNKYYKVNYILGKPFYSNLRTLLIRNIGFYITFIIAIIYAYLFKSYSFYTTLVIFLIIFVFSLLKLIFINKKFVIRNYMLYLFEIVIVVVISLAIVNTSNVFWYYKMYNQFSNVYEYTKDYYTPVPKQNAYLEKIGEINNELMEREDIVVNVNIVSSKKSV